MSNVLSIDKTYADTETLYAADLDEIIDKTQTFVNTTKLNDDNIQDSGITASDKLADSSVTTAKINDSAVTTAKINDAAVTAAKLASDAVTTVKIVDATITHAKLATRATGTSVAAGGVAISTSSSTFTRTSGSYGDVTNLSVTIVTTGRPVFLGLISADTGGVGSYLGSSITGTATQARFQFVRGSTALGEFELREEVSTAASLDIRVPVSSLFFIDTPSAGSYTYKLQALADAGTTAVTRAYLVAYEL